MKRKTFVLLVAAGLSFLPAVLQAQDASEPPAIAERSSEEAIKQKTLARRADEVTQQRFEAEVQRSQDQAAKQQVQAEGEYKRANAMYQDRLRNVIQRAPGSPGRSLVIRSSELDPNEQANLEEDLVVMSHVLEKTVGSFLRSQPQGSSVLGVNVVFAGGQNPTRALYLEGYGALFTLSVGFPLLPSPKSVEEKENPSADSTWNEARQEVFGERWEGKGFIVRGEEYDERKVNTLKDSVLEALKNATHIRGLKADDSVTVCVFGGGAALPIKAVTSNKPGVPNPKEVIRYGPDRPQPRTTMLTIRVKKSDVDSFAKDKFNLDDFRKRAKITPYAGGPVSATGGGFVGGGSGGTFGGGNTFGGGGGY